MPFSEQSERLPLSEPQRTNAIKDNNGDCHEPIGSRDDEWFTPPQKNSAEGCF